MAFKILFQELSYNI
ncbi:hypothetical protein MTR67_032347 [Solanum verrucosum]|uniref:Uncharacterized protein n=1 Tax=Solanum verrucosum TaxID=315347 RepID=A0AAF0U434_SOLVR|nr:hypothetical protein MTR67_032347 [Solanum verrucosum]